MPKEYITLPRVGGIKVRKKYYVSEVFEEHPAKADIPMMIWILKKFCKDGEVVLDPMAGIGTTMIEGMRLFPNSLFIGIELEHKFVKWANTSIKKTESIARENWFMKIGKAVCVQGNARDLQRVLKKKVDKIVSSPPYGEGIGHGGGNQRKIQEEKKIVLVNKYPADHKENIGNLPHGKIDKVVMSPTYSETRMDGGDKRGKRAGIRPYTDEPPDTWRTQRDQRNIGNLGHGKIDKVVLSPPYERTASPFTGGAPMPEDEGPHIGCRNIRTGYTKDRNNIGNTKAKTYLEAMFLVYQECFKVLKPDGLMVLITKDFIRDYKRVHLGEDTLKLCQMAGFKYIHTYYRRIDNPSFWRNDYYKKHPEVEQIDCEDILCFRKENEN